MRERKHDKYTHTHTHTKEKEEKMGRKKGNRQEFGITSLSPSSNSILLPKHTFFFITGKTGTMCSISAIIWCVHMWREIIPFTYSHL
jgi:hypothetical protein